jgi:hypothetical protein
MKTTFAETRKHAPVAGCLVIGQRDSRLWGIVGTKL